MSTDTAIIIHNQTEVPANTEEIPVPFQPTINEDADSLVWRQINDTLHKSLRESGYPQPYQSNLKDSFSTFDLPMPIAIAPGIAVGEDEYNKRYKDIDLEQYRQKMSPELFKVFVRHIGRINGSPDLNLNDIVITPE